MLRSLRVLDLAAGVSGLAVEFGLQGATVVAVDRAPDVTGRLARACRDIAPDRMTCLEADVLALDLEALGEFDVVLCLGLAGRMSAAEFAGLMRRVHVSARRVVVVDSAAGSGGAGAADGMDPTLLSGALGEAGMHLGVRSAARRGCAHGHARDPGQVGHGPLRTGTGRTGALRKGLGPGLGAACHPRPGQMPDLQIARSLLFQLHVCREPPCTFWRRFVPGVHSRCTFR